MGALEDCLEFLNVAGPGKVLLRTGSAAEALDARLAQLIGATSTSGRVSVFLPVSEAASPAVRDYLRDLVDKGVDPVVALVDPETATLVTDAGKLLSVQDDLGVALHAPLDAVAHGDLPHDRLVGVDADGQRTLPGELTNTYRLVPADQAAQRAALENLEASEAPASVERLRQWLAGNPAPAGSWDADLSSVAAAHYALFDALPGGEIDDLLESPRPVSLGELQDLLQSRLTSLGADTVWSEVESGRAAAALVNGWADGEKKPHAFYLVRDPTNGAMYWADTLAQGTLVPANPDGALDKRTAILERLNSTALLFDESGDPYTPVVLPVTEPAPLVSAHARPLGSSLLVGPWPAAAGKGTRQQILDVLAGHDGPVIAVDVRRGLSDKGLSALDSELKSQLVESLRRSAKPPVVLATEHNDELAWLVHNQYGGATVVPTMNQLGDLDGWDVRGQGPAEHYSVLSTGALEHAGKRAARTPAPQIPEPLREFRASPTWSDAERYFAENRTDLLMPESLQAVRTLIEQHQAFATAIGPGGVMNKDHPFFAPDHALPTFGAVLNVAANAAVDVNAGPMAPQDPSLLAEQVAPTTPVDESLPFGYLNTKPVPGTPGAFQDGLLWLRQLYLAALHEDVTDFGPDLLLEVLAGKGELEGERAARRPGAHELNRAHATIATALLRTVDPARFPGDLEPHDLVAAIDCLTGQDRVALHYIIRDDVLPRYPDAEDNLMALLEDIITC
jgi:hypothetical protein